MSGIAYELVPEADAPDTLQPGVSRYVEQADGTILQYIGDEDGNPVLVSGRGQVLFAADLEINKDSSNSQTVYCDTLGLMNIEYRYSDPDYYYGEVKFEDEFPNPANVKAKVGHSRRSELFSMQYKGYERSSNQAYIRLYAYEEGVDDSLIIDPGKFHVYVEIVQF